VLTAETLRNDFLDLWCAGQLPIKGVILVTHNIEEAVLMCDRLLLFRSQPGRIVSEIPVDLPKPRNATDPRFRAIMDHVYAEMTARPGADARAGTRVSYAGAGIGTMLVHVSSNLLAGVRHPITAMPTYRRLRPTWEWTRMSSCRSRRRCRCCAWPISPLATFA